MTLTDLLQSQLIDPFRIGLLIALLYTAIQNRAATGMVVPLAAGVVFVAVILPSTMGPGPTGSGAAAALPLWQVIAVGLVANAVILAVIMGVWRIVQRLRR